MNGAWFKGKCSSLWGSAVQKVYVDKIIIIYKLIDNVIHTNNIFHSHFTHTHGLFALLFFALMSWMGFITPTFLHIIMWYITDRTTYNLSKISPELILGIRLLVNYLLRRYWKVGLPKLYPMGQYLKGNMISINNLLTVHSISITGSFLLWPKMFPLAYSVPSCICIIDIYHLVQWIMDWNWLKTWLNGAYIFCCHCFLWLHHLSSQRKYPKIFGHLIGLQYHNWYLCYII